MDSLNAKETVPHDAGSPIPANELLFALGYPNNDLGQTALAALHAGAAYHRLAMICEVVDAYASEAQLPADEPAYKSFLLSCIVGEPPMATAKRLYRTALRIDDQLAEVWFNLARLLQASGDINGALVAFTRAAALPPHTLAQANAQLHANAHWHMATLLEEAGCDEDALLHYNEALARCHNFGVHHVRVANFMRRRGLFSEAQAHYEQLMTYSHRYFTEYVLPPLAPTSQTTSDVTPNLDVLYETSDGFPVVFWNNAYYRLPKEILPVTAAILEQMVKSESADPSQEKSFFRLLAWLFGRSRTSKGPFIQRAHAISEFEPLAPCTY
jgi:tetratricopeptide (TPR) repeat protein